ncbi:hypothetical protein BO996_18470 [Delftia sp. HK171]|uniref:DUF2189 domain-containing protein n=1 Tax=Delftia acidovorans TaxID=80866 RepID=A0AAJ2R2I2_DELAC|nr:MULTISPECIES: DUF2189 domain-containing protein [Delftia]APE49679.1 hypothetical protein BO996_18470 [Delftia sp. HK171]MDX4954444.1 DUF2189 domain-containing protein [Delftia acidovorans]
MQASPAPEKASDNPAGMLQVQLLRMADPWRWLALGWRDLRRAPRVALFYGLCFWAMALLIGWVFRASPEYSMAMASGCLLIGPFLAMGLYDTSRRLERGLPPQLSSSLTCWDTQMGSMGMLVMVLLVLEMLWARASMVVFAVFFDTGMPTTAGMLQAVARPENWEFLAIYLLVGGAFAALVFASMVVALPAMLDRGSDALTACITSMRVVGLNLAVMLQWAAIITVLVAVSLWWHGAGLLLVGPLLGCASWHAYRCSVGDSAVPASTIS